LDGGVRRPRTKEPTIDLKWGMRSGGAGSDVFFQFEVSANDDVAFPVRSAAEKCLVQTFEDLIRRKNNEESSCFLVGAVMAVVVLGSSPA
jgi:hypothetical protein